MKRSELKTLIKEIVKEFYNVRETLVESLPPGFSGEDLQTVDDFIESETGSSLEEKFGEIAPERLKNLPDDEIEQYMQRIATNKKITKGADADKYKYPYIHRSNIVDDDGNLLDKNHLINLIKIRPKNILKKNTKMAKSEFEGVTFYDISMPALRGLVVNEKTNEFYIVDTCPGAGACRVYCYAKKGGYVQWKKSSLQQTRVLNFLINDWQGFKQQLISEILSAASKSAKKLKGKNVKYDMILRWHDSGDFMSEKYLNIAYDIARETPNILHYAYTKNVRMVSGTIKPDNFVFNFSQGAIDREEREINPEKHKHSVVVPKPMFSRYMHKDKELDKWVFNSEEDLDKFKTQMANKYGIDKNTIITYDEMKKMSLSNDVNKWNVIVPAGSGDESAARRDVLGTYLLIH